MANITVGRYDHPESVGYQGWMEPDDKAWILFIREDGRVDLFDDRDPETGAVK